MTVRRQTRKVDKNQAEIVAALRKAGCSVIDLSMVGGGVPDLAVGTVRGDLILMELKLPQTIGKRGKPVGGTGLNDKQKDFHATWPGRIVVCTTPAEALAAVGVIQDGIIAPEPSCAVLGPS